MDDQTLTSHDADETAAPIAAEAPVSRGWRDAWQIPLAVAGLAMIVLGLVTLSREAPGPDFKGILSDVRVLLEQQKPVEALEVLNGPIRDYLAVPPATNEIIAEYHALRGESLYLAFRESRPDMSLPASKRNNENTLSEFEKAEHLDHAQLTPRREAFIAETLLDLGRIDDALERARHLPEDHRDRRHRLFKRVITEAMEGPEAFRGRAFELISELRQDPELPESDRLWAIGKEMTHLLEQGKADEVIDGVLPELQRTANPDSIEAGELRLLLARAYVQTGEIAAARAQFQRAESAFQPGDDRRGQVDVGLASVSQSLGELEEARDRFATVVERFPGEDAQAMALLGLAETESDLGRYEQSLTAFNRLVELIREKPGQISVTPDAVEGSLEQRHRARVVVEDYESALRFAELSVEVYRAAGIEAPARASLRLAETHRAAAEKLLGNKGEAIEDASPAALGRLDPAVVEKARVHFDRAGAAFASYSAASMVQEPEEGSRALWNAADSYDRAGDQNKAIQLFTDFVQNRRNDPKQLEGRFRLARCFQSMNQYTTAISIFEQIIRDNPGADEAFRSFVPLAQSYLLASADADADKAERLLLQVLDGRMFQPSAPQFKRALIELGQMYVRIGRYPEAVTRLTEAIERYPTAPEAVRLRFDLADACRLSAAQIEKDLREAMPLSERGELERQREQRLRLAMDYYEEVRASLDAMDSARLSPIQKVLLRNAVLFRADCAFDLRDYDAAIRYYDAAAQRFASDPASLVPMVQIVSCYTAQGKWAEARTAHERAKARLKELPESAWAGASIPMDRKHWERWMESSLGLEERVAGASLGDQP